MTKKIGILVEHNYEDLELWYPFLRFKEEGYDTFTIGPEKGKGYKSKNNYTCRSDKCIDEVSAESLDALICPGGWCPEYLRRDKRFLNLIRAMVTLGKIVGTICHGAWMLCSAKCIQGRKVTCLDAIKDDVQNAGAEYIDAPVIVDGNLVSSRIPSDLPEFCKAIISKFKN